jgi:hypothetical protein
MKRMFALVCCFTALSLFAPPAHATDFVLASLQCDPSSCTEQTLPTFVGSAFVSYNATCTGSGISVEGSASSQVGVDGPCNSPFIARARVTTSTKTELDDFGCEFNIDSVTAIGEVLSPLGVVVFQTQAGVACDGGVFGPTNNGVAPC